jgi:hypothetical protein
VEPPATAPNPAPATVTQTTLTIASLDHVYNEVYITDASSRRRAKDRDVLAAGEGIETVGYQSAAVILYPDKTSLEIGPNTIVRDFQEGRGKSLFLKNGNVQARVTRQPAGREMVLAASQGEVRVLGTTLRLYVDPKDDDALAVEVTMGKARLTRRADGKFVDVPSGHFAITTTMKADRTPPRSPRLIDDFEDKKSYKWELLSMNAEQTSPGYRSDKAMLIKHNEPFQSESWASRPFTHGYQNWTGFDGIRFAFKGTGSGEAISFQVYDDFKGVKVRISERFEYVFADTSTQWRVIEIPWKLFVRCEPQPHPNVPVEGLTLLSVRGYGLFSVKSAQKPQTWGLDTVELYQK